MLHLQRKLHYDKGGDTPTVRQGRVRATSFDSKPGPLGNSFPVDDAFYNAWS